MSVMSAADADCGELQQVVPICGSCSTVDHRAPCGDTTWVQNAHHDTYYGNVEPSSLLYPHTYVEHDDARWNNVENSYSL